jgi:CheY-like chemotaxis protein
MKDILVVDDEFASRRVLARLLGKQGYRVREAADGPEALALVRAEHPDLVIVDLLMPQMDGFELVRRLRSEPAIARTRVIFYSATYLIEEVTPMARACGVSHVLQKTAAPETILDAVADALAAPAPDGAPPSAGDFNREHLRLVAGRLAGAFRTVLAGMADLVGAGRVPSAGHEADTTVMPTC